MFGEKRNKKKEKKNNAIVGGTLQGERATLVLASRNYLVTELQDEGTYVCAGNMRVIAAKCKVPVANFNTHGRESKSEERKAVRIDN